MVNVLRRFSKPIMLVITVLVIITFSVWMPNITRSGGGTFAYLYGKPVSLEQFSRQKRKLDIYGMLGGAYARVVPQGARNENQAIARSIVFEHEAEALGLSATEQQMNEVLFS